MKHWIEFIPENTNTTRILGKIARTLRFEVLDKEIALQNAKKNFESLEREICEKIERNYTNKQDYENAIYNAKNKADEWNNEPINNRKPPIK